MTRACHRKLLAIGAAIIMPHVMHAADANPMAGIDETIANAKAVMMTDPGKGLAVGQRLQDQVTSPEFTGNRTLALAKARWVKAEALGRLKRLPEARREIAESLRLATISNDPKAKGSGLMTRAFIKSEVGDVVGAVKDYVSAYAYATQAHDPRMQSVSLQLLANIYNAAGNYEKAIEYLNQARDTYKADPLLQLSLENNLGNISLKLGRLDESLHHLRNGVRIAAENKFSGLELRTLGNIAAVQVKAGDVPGAEKTLARARFLTRNQPANIFEIPNMEAIIALAEGKTREARFWLEILLKDPDTEPAILSNAGIHELAYSIYKANGDYDLALHHLEALSKIHEDSASIATSSNAALTAAKFDYANQELKIATLESQDLRRAAESERRTYKIVVSSVLALLVVAAVALISILRSRDRANAACSDLADSNAALEAALAEVEARQRAELEATRLAEHDALTGLPNRRHLTDHLFERVRRDCDDRQDCSILLLDLDNFKPINDNHGHEAGDAVLTGVAERLREICGRHGASPIRLGGDEFVIVLAAPRGTDAPSTLATEIIKEISRPYQLSDRHLIIGTSIGISQYPHDGETLRELLGAADIAMYEAKKSGRRTCRFFDSDMDVQIRRRSATEQDLRQAVAEGRIQTYFQPIYSYGKSSITSFEALARWQHHLRGMVPPDEFIPIAEETGLIGAITESILSQACRAAKDWPSEVSVSVNLSPILLRTDWISRKIFKILQKEDLPASRLTIEITETAVIDDLELASKVIDSLRAAGVRIALDDFGKGYSSLSHLRHLHFDHVKLDASFVRTLKEPDSMKITTAVAGLGRAMGIAVTAEGVETVETADQLADMGFSYAQGYLFGRPLPADETKAIAWAGRTDESQQKSDKIAA